MVCPASGGWLRRRIYMWRIRTVSRPKGYDNKTSGLPFAFCICRKETKAKLLCILSDVQKIPEQLLTPDTDPTWFLKPANWIILCFFHATCFIPVC